LIKRLKPLVTSPEQLAREAKAERRKKRRLARFGHPARLAQDPSDPLDLFLGIISLEEEKLRRWQIAALAQEPKTASATL
jgi:hypothetical protein